MKDKPEKKIGTVSGVCLIVATIVGGGMFSLPVALEGVWFVKGIMLLIFSSVIMLLTGLMIYEVNLKFPLGSSFHSFSKVLLPRSLNIITGISFAFVLYCVTYAYISGAASSLDNTLHYLTGVNLGRWSVAVIFLLVVSVMLWAGTRIGKILSVLIIGKFTSFILTFSGMIGSVDTNLLFSQYSIPHLSTWLIALPFCIISFGFHGSIPSLVNIYGKQNSKKIIKSIVIGVFISLFIYVFWLSVTMGNLSKTMIDTVVAKGGNIGDFLDALRADSQSSYFKILLLFFGNFAISASLLSATIGLIDYIKDLFKLHLRKNGNSTALMITYLPPSVCCFFFPNGFVPAIAYAGIGLTIWSILLPPLLVRKSRQTLTDGQYRLPFGNSFFGLFFIIGLLIFTMVCYATFV